MLRPEGTENLDAAPAREAPLLDIRGLKTHFATDDGIVQAVDGVDIAPHWALASGAAIFLTVLSINFIGDGLRDALDPRRVL